MGVRASSLPFGTNMFSTELKGLTLGDMFMDERGREFMLYQLDVTANLTGSAIAAGDLCYLLAPLVVNNKLSAATGGGANDYVISAGVATVAFTPISGSTLYILLLTKGRHSTVNSGTDTSTAGAYAIIDTGNDGKIKTVAQTDTTAQTAALLNRHVGRTLVTVASGAVTDVFVNIPMGLR